MADKTSLADWISDHAAVCSLDSRESLDDLEPLRGVIGDARVVAIGESAHHVREFYLLRRRIMQFLVERCGFTVYALEAPFTEAQIVDAWIRGGPGTAADVAAGISFGMGNCREMRDHLEWMRGWNGTADRPLRFVGAGLPASGGSPLAALDAVGAYLRAADPEALPLLAQAVDLARSGHDPATFPALFRYVALEPTTQDALTATLSRLLARLETIAADQRRRGRGQEHAAALAHLRGAWLLDHFHRDLAGRGLPGEHPHAFHDLFLAETVLRLLAEGGADVRIVVAFHNIHIQKTPIAHDGGTLLPGGFHLAEALGDGYVAIAATSKGGRTAVMRPDAEQPLGFALSDRPLPPLAGGAIETAFRADAPVAIADLRAARPAVGDAASFQRMRMEDSFVDVAVFDAFDAVASIAQTNCIDFVTAQPGAPDPAPSGLDRLR